MKYGSIFWLTGMSGAGKSTLASTLKSKFNKNLRIKIVDGDIIRDKDDSKLSFSYNDVLLNNSRIANYCKAIRLDYDLIIVAVIAPYDEIRLIIRNILEPNFHLVYLKSDINSLKDRDTKGLYLSADKGLITNLIGYSESNPYEEPSNAELVIDTSNLSHEKDSFSKLYKYVSEKISC